MKISLLNPPNPICLSTLLGAPHNGLCPLKQILDPPLMADVSIPAYLAVTDCEGKAATESLATTMGAARNSSWRGHC